MARQRSDNRNFSAANGAGEAAVAECGHVRRRRRMKPTEHL